MKLRTTISFSPLLLVLAPALLPSRALPLLPNPQERQKKVEAKDFPSLLTGAKAAWEAGHFGKASAALKEATSLVATKHREVIVAAFPSAPEGWAFKPSKPNDAAGMMMGFAGMAIEGKYTGPEGSNVKVNLSVDSPMIQMMSMAFSNPALLGDGAEVITYGKYKALLKKSGRDGFELSILIGDDLFQANSHRVSDDDLLALCNQAMVDKLAAALAN